MTDLHPIAALRLPMPQGTASGREHALPTGRFREAEFHWPLSGDEFEEWTDATRPGAVRQNNRKLPFGVVRSPFIDHEIWTNVIFQGTPVQPWRWESTATTESSFLGQLR